MGGDARRRCPEPVGRKIKCFQVLVSVSFHGLTLDDDVLSRRAGFGYCINNVQRQATIEPVGSGTGHVERRGGGGGRAADGALSEAQAQGKLPTAPFGQQLEAGREEGCMLWFRHLAHRHHRHLWAAARGGSLADPRAAARRRPPADPRGGSPADPRSTPTSADTQRHHRLYILVSAISTQTSSAVYSGFGT